MSIDQGQRSPRAHSLLLVGVLSIAWSAIFVRWTHTPGNISAFDSQRDGAGLLQGFSFHVPSSSAWLAMLGLGLICQLLGYLALTHSLGLLPATVTSVSLLAQAPLTSLLALFFFAERLQAPQIAGGVLVLCGVWIVTSGSTRRMPDSAA